MCGARVPWRLSPRGVLLESAAAAVGMMAILVAVWVWRGSDPGQLAAPPAVVRLAATAAPTSAPPPAATAITATLGVPTAVAATAAPPAAVEHTIQSGDTLWNLAAEHDTTVDDILAANAGELSLDRLSIGQVIKIPQPGGAEPPAPSDAGATIAAPPDEGAPAATAPPDEAAMSAALALAAARPTIVVVDSVSVTVAAADTLSTLAEAHGVTVDDVVAANGLDGADAVIQVGQALVVKTAVVVTATPLPGGLAGGQPGADAGQAALPEPLQPDTSSYPSPLMLSPLSDTVVADDAPVLRWSSIGPLPSGVVYVVRVRDADADDADAVAVPVRGGATAVRIPARFRPALGAARQLAWSVAVGRAGIGLLGSGELTMLSGPPTWHTFTWSAGDGATPTSAP